MGTWKLGGFRARVKSDMVADTDVCAGVILFAPDAVTVPPLNVADPPFGLAVGVSTIVMIAVEPEFRDAMLQLTVELLAPPLQVPALAVAETKLTGMMVYVSEI